MGLHAHASRYDFTSGESAEQSARGTGVAGFFLVGLAKNELGLGLSASGVYVPNAQVRSKNAVGIPETAQFERATWAFTVGPGVAYRATDYFSIGGLMGFALEQVPKFTWPSDGSDRLLAFGAGVWLGFDWELTAGTRLGIMALFENRVHQRREEYVDATRNEEQSLSASLGASLTLF